jgi:hypothetical protein
MRIPNKGGRQGKIGAAQAFRYLHPPASSCRTVSTRPMLKSRLSSLCSRSCPWITRASRARRYVLSSVIYACSHYRSMGGSEAAWWVSVNLTPGQRSDRARDEAVDPGFAGTILAIGSRRTTKVKHELDRKVPHVVAQEPPPR